MSSAEITIRSIQHYMYCPHRWGLIEIDKAWAENLFVTKANLMHNRVHDPEKRYPTKAKKVYTAVSVYNDLSEYNLYGVVDCLELQKSSRGVSVDQSGELYKFCIVEYKPTKPKNKEYHEEDLLQVYAQKLCVDYIFGVDSDAELYYADVKKRVVLPIRENKDLYDQKLRDMLKEMREYLDKGKIPAIRKGQKCSGCSMKDLCMPTIRTVCDFRTEIHKIGDTESIDGQGEL